MPRSSKLHFLVLVFVLLPSLSRAGETKMTKPEIPPSAQATKNAEGGFVASFINSFNSVRNFVCPPAQPLPIAVEKRKITPRAPRELPSEAFKSEGELARYLECYATEDGRYELIAKRYMPLIAVASRTFEIPQTLLACLIFRESRFDVNARSKSGAMGLGQHLAGTMTTITNTIEKPESSSPQEKTRVGKIRKRLEDIDNGVIKNETPQDRQDRAYLATRAEMRFQRTNWEQYYNNLRSQGLHKGGITPRVVNEAALKDPAIAIGATAFYLQSILLVFQKRLDSDLVIRNSDRQQPNYDLLLAAAGAYNMGPYEASKILGKLPEPPDRKKWVGALAKSNEETAGHILSIRNCIESSGSKGENAWKAPIGSADYSCKPEDMGEKRVALDKANKLPSEYKSEIKSATMKAAIPKAPPKVKATDKPSAKSTVKPATKAGSSPKPASVPAKKGSTK